MGILDSHRYPSFNPSIIQFNLIAISHFTMSDFKATVSETKSASGHAGFHVTGYERIEYGFTFIDGIFDPSNTNLADCYKKWGRCLAVTDQNIYNVYGKQMEAYFQHHGLELKIHKTKIGEKVKTMPTLLSIVDSMNEFCIYRKEPVLVVGGGLVTDVAGFACAAYKRNTNFIRIPTTVIGLIDASVSIKVAVNYGNYKNRLGAYHAPQHTFLDFAFLRTLPEAQIRNGFAELIKISTCSHLDTFNLLDKYCEQLIEQSFGRANGSSQELIDAADKINREGIHEMLRLETPNLHEIGLDRVIAYGHTWSPLHELVPETPLRHGHAISIDMAYSATLANNRKLISDEEHRRLLNDVSSEEMNEALSRHKELMKEYPRNGEGIEAYVDASDTGYTENPQAEEERMVEAAAKKAGSLNGANGKIQSPNVSGIDKVTNGTNDHHTNKNKTQTNGVRKGSITEKEVNGNGYAHVVEPTKA